MILLESHQYLKIKSKKRKKMENYKNIWFKNLNLK